MHVLVIQTTIKGKLLEREILFGYTLSLIHTASCVLYATLTYLIVGFNKHVGWPLGALGLQHL